MTKTQFVVMFVVVTVALTATVCAQEAEFKVRDGWVVSPENEKAEGEAGYRILHEETGIEMVYVPGGTLVTRPDGGEYTWGGTSGGGGEVVLDWAH